MPSPRAMQERYWSKDGLAGRGSPLQARATAKGIAFSDGISSTDEPAVLIRDLTDRLTKWSISLAYTSRGESDTRARRSQIELRTLNYPSFLSAAFSQRERAATPVR